eukprot:scaffold2438_cov388-Prasinococcus_capsulatus_cf.AAC.1
MLLGTAPTPSSEGPEKGEPLAAARATRAPDLPPPPPPPTPPPPLSGACRGHSALAWRHQGDGEQPTSDRRHGGVARPKYLVRSGVCARTTNSSFPLWRWVGVSWGRGETSGPGCVVPSVVKRDRTAADGWHARPLGSHP